MLKKEKVFSPREQTKANESKGVATEEKAKVGVITHTKAAEEANKLINRQYQNGWAGVKQGKPVAWVMYGPPREILRCFDILDIYPENYGALCAMKQQTSPYIEYAEEDGFSARICGYLLVALGYARSLARGEPSENAAFGGMPKPDMLLSSSRLCDPRSKIFETMRRYLNVPAFIYDHQVPPLEERRCMDREACEHYIEHNMEGLKGLVTFLEKQTGKRMDWDRLSELVRNSIETWHLYYEIYGMRKNIPSPMPSEDLASVWRPFLDMTGEAEALQFYRNVKQELEERIRSKVSVVPNEKFRLLWLGLPTWFDMEIFNYLESWGAVSVVESIFHPSRPRKVDTSNPLRALAEKWFWGWDSYGGSDGSQIKCGLASGSHILELAKDYSVDGVIAHTILSCRAVSIGHRHMAKVLREQMGLPVLTIESHMTDPRSYSRTEVREKIDVFINVLEGRK